MTSILERHAAPAVDETTTVKTVTDNAKYAWDDSSDFCLHRLPADFVAEYRNELDAAGIPAMEAELAAEWERRGYTVRWVSEREMEAHEDRLVPGELQWEAWEKAADRIDPYALVAAADLSDVLRYWSED
jgi:hypothetical protein